MIQNVVRQMGGIAIFGVISVCLFFTVFGVALVWAFLQKKSFLETMSALPLEEERKGENSHE